MKIVFSYDCEGNWGFVDWAKPPLEGYDPIALEQVYQTLCKTHQEQQIEACFAFVGLYTLPQDARHAWVKEHLADLTDTLPNLLAGGGFWEGQKNIECVAQAADESPMISIGSHGLTHRPFVGLDPAEQQREFTNSAEILTQTAGRTPRAFIYPRNLVSGVQDCLHTYASYRDTETVTLVQRAVDLNRAVIGVDFPRTPVTSDFMFWEGGHRRHFNDTGWRRLWRGRMAAARRGRDRDRIIHVWSHPHNFLTDPDLPARFQWLMRLLSDNRDVLMFEHLHDVPMGTGRGQL